ncbi:MAG: sporulation membrane protein YtaF [Defluviitaleaceae bacterium]|nr:sporulation membrane protein YtaF [Defluviitaleaceae bacterium]
MDFIQVFFLVSMLSLDAFVISISYGASKIIIPKKSILVINFVGSFILFISLYFGFFLRNFITNPDIFSSIILFGLGASKIFDGTIKNLIKKNQIRKKIKFSIFSINFILTIYANPKEADIDESRYISPKEAIALGVVLALDNLAAGIGAGLILNPINVAILSFLIDPIFIFFGLKIGKKISKIDFDLSFVSGIVFIILALI